MKNEAVISQSTICEAMESCERKAERTVAPSGQRVCKGHYQQWGRTGRFRELRDGPGRPSKADAEGILLSDLAEQDGHLEWLHSLPIGERVHYAVSWLSAKLAASAAEADTLDEAKAILDSLERVMKVLSYYPSRRNGAVRGAPSAAPSVDYPLDGNSMRDILLARHRWLQAVDDDLPDDAWEDWERDVRRLASTGNLWAIEAAAKMECGGWEIDFEDDDEGEESE